MKKTRKYLLLPADTRPNAFPASQRSTGRIRSAARLVSSITAKVSGNNQVTVTWKKAKNATSYRVYYKQAAASGKPLPTSTIPNTPTLPARNIH